MAYNENVAYKYAYDYEEYIQQNTPKRPKVKIQPQVKTSKKCALYIARISVIALSAAFMVSTFISVHDTKLVVANLTSELKKEETVTNQKAYELDNSFSLSEIETEATSRLGMQRPESYQYVYVNVKQQDSVEKIASAEEGVIKSIRAALSSFFGHIVDFFSIK